MPLFPVHANLYHCVVDIVVCSNNSWITYRSQWSCHWVVSFYTTIDKNTRFPNKEWWCYSISITGRQNESYGVCRITTKQLLFCFEYSHNTLTWLKGVCRQWYNLWEQQIKRIFYTGLLTENSTAGIRSLSRREDTMWGYTYLYRLSGVCYRAP